MLPFAIFQGLLSPEQAAQARAWTALVAHVRWCGAPGLKDAPRFVCEEVASDFLVYLADHEKAKLRLLGARTGRYLREAIRHRYYQRKSLSVEDRGLRVYPSGSTPDATGQADDDIDEFGLLGGAAYGVIHNASFEMPLEEDRHIRDLLVHEFVSSLDRRMQLAAAYRFRDAADLGSENLERVAEHLHAHGFRVGKSTVHNEVGNGGRFQTKLRDFVEAHSIEGRDRTEFVAAVVEKLVSALLSEGMGGAND